MNIRNDVRGPILWSFMELLLLQVDSNGKPKLGVSELYEVAYAIPCEECRGHFAEYLSFNYPSNDRSYEQWKERLLEFHNTVSSRTGGEYYTMEKFDDKLNFYKEE